MVSEKIKHALKQLKDIGDFNNYISAFVIPPGYQKMFQKWQEIEHKCYLLSKNLIHSKSEIVNMVIEQAKTSTMDFEQAFYFISGKLSNGKYNS